MGRRARSTGRWTPQWRVGERGEARDGFDRGAEAEDVAARCGLATTWRTSPRRYPPVTTGESGDPDPPAMALAISRTVTGRPLAMFSGTVVRVRQ